jgi:Tol biopolymer transport system component
MGYRWALSAALCGACYGPAVTPGAPCGPNEQCPSGLECRNNVCVLPGSSGDDAAAPDDAMVDATQLVTDATPDAAPLGAWGTPALLTTGVSSETDPSMTLNRLTIAFSSEATNDLYLGTRGTPNATTLTATALAVLNSASDEKAPEISPDGLTIYFTSNRSGNYDIYRSTFSTVWSPPALMSDLSTAGDESDFAISPDGLTAVVIDNGTANRFLIHTRGSTAQPFGGGVHRPELTVGTDPSAPTITNNGDVIYFHTGTTRDLYVATRKPDGTYTTAVPVTELNTGSRDAAPFVLQDNRHLLFERSSDLYETAR